MGYGSQDYSDGRSSGELSGYKEGLNKGVSIGKKKGLAQGLAQGQAEGRVEAIETSRHWGAYATQMIDRAYAYALANDIVRAATLKETYALLGYEIGDKPVPRNLSRLYIPGDAAHSAATFIVAAADGVATVSRDEAIAHAQAEMQRLQEANTDAIDKIVDGGVDILNLEAPEALDVIPDRLTAMLEEKAGASGGVSLYSPSQQ